ncbi:unnamed protein product [Brassicogethes aeneus]|uniref:Alcohol dehydrogenase n=1 Tax=Brassicogethes aeneus TaxID=1431903 RepID=A0A9P0AY52_BRAAE|nr:unnamed protein product [Brassicogethes aeneus]
MPDFQIGEKVALVTGGATGIGLEYVRYLLQHGLKNAVVEGCLLAFKYMSKHYGGNGGVVVNAGSILSLREFSGCPIYTGTKHFIVGLTKSFGTPYFLNLTGVRFLTMCPGVTYTPLISEAGRFALTDFPKIAEILVQDLGSYPAQQPEDVAQGLITMITKGENGSVWVSEGGEPVYEVILPDLKTWRKK